MIKEDYQISFIAHLENVLSRKFTYQSLSHHKLMELIVLSVFLQKADRAKNYAHKYRNANKFCLKKKKISGFVQLTIPCR